ncbi:MAG: hypothetical protein WCJ56_03845 [bacterium]
MLEGCLGCLGSVFGDFLFIYLLYFLIPWLNPEPNAALNRLLYAISMLITGAIGIYFSLQIPVEEFGRMVSFSLFGYFTLLTIWYLPWKRGGE